MQLTGLALLVDVVAAYRLTRLATADVLTQPMREHLIRWTYIRDPDRENPAVPVFLPTAWQETVEDDPNPPKLATLITCRWCSGVWIGALVAAARWTIPGVWAPIAYALTAATAAAFLARMEDR